MSTSALTICSEAHVSGDWAYTPQIGDDTFFRWLDTHCLGINRLIVRLFG